MAGREPRRGQLRQSVAERVLAHQFETGDQFVAELAADHRTHLGDFLADRDAVETGHQRVAQRLRDRDLGRRAGIDITVARDDQVARLQDGLGQFFDEQRHAVGPGNDLAHEAGRQRPAADDIGDQRTALLRGELGQIHHGDGWMGCPWRVEFGTRGDDEKRRNVGKHLHQAPEQVARRRVGPVRVLEQKQRRFVRAPRPGRIRSGRASSLPWRAWAKPESRRSAPGRGSTAAPR